MKIFDYNTVIPNKSVVVLAGGYSSGIYVKEIAEYIRCNSSSVFVANYNYGIKSDYTFLGDYKIFKRSISSIKGNIVVSRSLKRLYKKSKYGNRIYVVKHSGLGNIYHSKRVNISDDGSLPYKNLATSGLACIVLSLWCRPAKMLLVGFDGPTADASVKKKFDGSVVKYKKPAKREKEMRYLENSLVPSLHDLKIRIETFPDVLFYGISKKKLGLTVL